MADNFYARYAGFGASGLGSGVTSLNGETGALTLTAGTGIAITTPTSSTIQIASTSAGDVTLGAFGSTPNANGLTLTGQVLNMEPADGTHPGGLSITTQTIAGNKSFTGTTSTHDILAGTDDTYNIGAASGVTRFKNGYFSSTLSVGVYPPAGGQSVAALVNGSSPKLLLYAGGSNAYQVASDGGGLQLQNTGTAVSILDITGTSFAFKNENTGVQYFGGNATTVTALGNLAAANLSGTNTGDVTLGTANGLSLTGQVLSLGTSSASTTGALTSTDWSTFNSKQAAGNYITALTGDATASGPGSAALTLATVNANVGSFGSSTAIPSLTVNAKGLVTAASTNVVIAPAGTLTGTTLAANVVFSSLTTVGTIGTGVWQGTPLVVSFGGTGLVNILAHNVLVGNGTSAITVVQPAATSGVALISQGSSSDPAFGTVQIAGGGTGAVTKAAGFDALSPMTTGGDIIYGGASGTGTRLANGSAGQFLTSSGTTVAPTWTTGFSNPLTTTGDIIYGVSSTPTRLAGNITATKEYLSQTGNGSVSAAPAWAQVATADLSGTISSAQVVTATFTAPTSQIFTSGTAQTYTTPTSPRTPLYLRVRLWGGGGGGAGSGSASSSSNGANGVATTFKKADDSVTYGSAGGGNGAAWAGGSPTGGTSSVASATQLAATTGSSGGSGHYQGSLPTISLAGGNGGGTSLGGAGGSTFGGAAGSNAATNTGSGGGGGGGNAVAGSYSGAGGGAGGFVELIITSTNATYHYTVGGGGAAGSAGTSGFGGGTGAAGLLIVEEFYQ